MNTDLYSNTKYYFDRDESKTIIISVPMTTGVKTFSVNLIENITIDKHSEVYLDSLTTFNCNTSHASEDDMGFVLSIDQFEIKSSSNQETGKADISRSVFIPNEQNSPPAAGGSHVDTSKSHKGKKLNYICSINPININRISGKLTNIAGETIFTAPTGGRFIAEFVIIGKKN